MTAKEAQNQLKEALKERYDTREAAAIANWIVEEVTGLGRADRLVRDLELTDPQLVLFNQYRKELLQGNPMQYVLGYAWFLGHKFLVNQHVLIPRPETEELVQWLLDNVKDGSKILDIGSGSGCIPIVIAKKLPAARVSSVDISTDALAVAKQNAALLGAGISWIAGDFLDPEFREALPVPQVIISNPPYIPWSDQSTMAAHVVDHEPQVALFVPNEDPLVFYREIIGYGSRHGVGEIYLETHHQLAREVALLGEGRGYRAEVRRDVSANERMVKLDLNA